MASVADDGEESGPSHGFRGAPGTLPGHAPVIDLSHLGHQDGRVLHLYGIGISLCQHPVRERVGRKDHGRPSLEAVQLRAVFQALLRVGLPKGRSCRGRRTSGRWPRMWARPDAEVRGPSARSGHVLATSTRPCPWWKSGGEDEADDAVDAGAHQVGGGVFDGGVRVLGAEADEIATPGRLDGADRSRRRLALVSARTGARCRQWRRSERPDRPTVRALADFHFECGCKRARFRPSLAGVPWAMIETRRRLRCWPASPSLFMRRPRTAPSA